jgi:hypothetical protein
MNPLSSVYLLQDVRREIRIKKEMLKDGKTIGGRLLTNDEESMCEGMLYAYTRVYEMLSDELSRK